VDVVEYLHCQLKPINHRFSKTADLRIFQSFEGNTELQITEVDNTVSDECVAIATSVGHSIATSVGH